MKAPTEKENMFNRKSLKSFNNLFKEMDNMFKGIFDGSELFKTPTPKFDRSFTYIVSGKDSKEFLLNYKKILESQLKMVNKLIEEKDES